MPDLESVYLIGGSDRPKVDEAIKRLRRHFDTASVDRFDAATVDAATVVAACNAGTLFGDTRLVLVDQVDGRPADDGRMRVTWKAAEIEIVVEYLRSPAPGTVLCLVATEVKKDAALVKAVTKAGTVLGFEIEKKKTVGWVADRFRSAGVRVDPEAAALLVALVGETDKHALAQEIDKVITWALSDADVTVGEHRGPRSRRSLGRDAALGHHRRLGSPRSGEGAPRGRADPASRRHAAAASGRGRPHRVHARIPPRQAPARRRRRRVG